MQNFHGIRTCGQTWYKLVYNIYISVDIAHHEIFRAKVVKGSIKSFLLCLPCHRRVLIANFFYLLKSMIFVPFGRQPSGTVIIQIMTQFVVSYS